MHWSCVVSLNILSCTQNVFSRTVLVSFIHFVTLYCCWWSDQRCADCGRVSPRTQICKIFLQSQTDADPIFLFCCGCGLRADPWSESADSRGLKNFGIRTSLLLMMSKLHCCC